MVSLRTLSVQGKAHEQAQGGGVEQGKRAFAANGRGLHAGARAMGEAGHRKTPKNREAQR
jgi:hypothetical protein